MQVPSQSSTKRVPQGEEVEVGDVPPREVVEFWRVRVEDEEEDAMGEEGER